MEAYVGKIGNRTVSSSTPVIVTFADNQVLEFQTEKEARGFLAFYHANPTAHANNPGRIYSFQAGAWLEATE